MFVLNDGGGADAGAAVGAGIGVLVCTNVGGDKVLRVLVLVVVFL